MDIFSFHVEFWHWFALALIFIIIDVLTGANFLFLWGGISAALVGFLLLFVPNITPEYQLMVFGFGVMSSILVWYFFLRKRSKPSDRPTLNLRNEQYIGRFFHLDEPIINGRGRTRVGDTWWRVGGEDMPAGTRVQVVGVDGVILLVEKVD